MSTWADDRLDGDPLVIDPAEFKIEEAEPMRIVETTAGWVRVEEHLAGKHNQKSHGRHHSAAVAATFRDGGYSVDYVGRKPTTGYMVGGVAPGAVVSGGRAEVKAAMSKFYDDNRSILKQPGMYLGTWRDGGKTYIDISQRVPTKFRALKVGGERGELAIYDIRRGDSLDVPKGGDG